MAGDREEDVACMGLLFGRSEVLSWVGANMANSSILSLSWMEMSSAT